MPTRDEIVRLSLDYLRSRASYSKAIERQIRDTPAMEISEELWGMMSTLLGAIDGSRRFGQDAVKHACSRFIWTCTHGSPDGANVAGWTKAASFLVAYRGLTHRAAVALTNLPGIDMGGDAFGDLCDSFPLVSKDLLGQIEDGSIYHYDQLADAIPKKIHGENYVDQHFTAALVRAAALCFADEEIAEACRESGGDPFYSVLSFSD